MVSLQGRGAIVTGGGVGIGTLRLFPPWRGLVQRWRTPISDMHPTSDHAPGGRSVSAHLLDVTKSDEVDRVFEEVSDRLGGEIDILVNNAGGL